MLKRSSQQQTMTIDSHNTNSNALTEEKGTSRNADFKNQTLEIPRLQKSTNNKMTSSSSTSENRPVLTAVQTVLTNTTSETSSDHVSSNQQKQQQQQQIDNKMEVTTTQENDENKKKKPYGGRPLRFQCEHCDRRFHAPSHLKRHLLCHSSERPYQCEVCKKGFLQAWHLSRHMTTHTGNKPFSCPECSKTFGSRFEMKTHCNYIHRGIKEHKCDECGKMFTLRSNLKVHMRKHTGEKPYHCEQCGKSFGQRGHLQYHMRKHKEIPSPKEQPAVTETIVTTDISCEDRVRSPSEQSYDSGIDLESVSSGRQSTKTLSDDEDEDQMIDVVSDGEGEIPLSSRIFDHTNPNELKPFVCVSCNCGFGEINSLVSHVRHSHPKKLITNPIYSCAYCNKSFYEIEHLSLHFNDEHSLKRKTNRKSVITYNDSAYYGHTYPRESSPVSCTKEACCTCDENEMKLVAQERYLAYLHHYHKMLESKFHFMQMMNKQ